MHVLHCYYCGYCSDYAYCKLVSLLVVLCYLLHDDVFVYRYIKHVKRMHDSAESKKAVKRDGPAVTNNSSSGSSSAVLLGSSSNSNSSNKRGALQCGASTTDVFAQLDSRAAAAGAHCF
jgi:hypothetical protein